MPRYTPSFRGDVVVGRSDGEGNVTVGDPGVAVPEGRGRVSVFEMVTGARRDVGVEWSDDTLHVRCDVAAVFAERLVRAWFQAISEAR